MGFVKAIGFCPKCGVDAVYSRFVCPLWVHMALTLATAGIWLLAAPLARLHGGSWRCSRCGGRLPSGRRQLIPLDAPPAFDALRHRRVPPGGAVNSLLVGHHLVYDLPTNATFRNDGAR